MRLLNESLLKFIIFYFKTQSNAVTANYEQTSYLLDLIDNLLLDNEFCYLNLLKDSLNKTVNKNSNNDPNLIKITKLLILISLIK